MLSSDMLKFAEPIGPGQIVDRQSLVSMPSGYAKILLSKQEQEVSIRVITFEERYNSKESVLKTSSKVFLALGTQVVEAEERFILAQDDNEPVSKKWIHVLDRNRLKSDKTTNEILQVCVFSSVSLGGGNKTLIGMVHIAFEEIQRMLPVPSNKFVTSGWYKVFPSSSFVAGCPVAAGTPHCANRCTRTGDHKSFQTRLIHPDTSPKFHSLSFEDVCKDVKTGGISPPAHTHQFTSSKSLRRFTKYSASIGSFMRLVHRVKIDKPVTETQGDSSSSVDVGYESSGNSSCSIPLTSTKESTPEICEAETTKPEAQQQPNNKILRSLSMLSRRTKNCPISRRSFSIADKQKGLKYKSTFRRSEEITALPIPPTEMDQNSFNFSSSCPLSKEEDLGTGKNRSRMTEFCGSAFLSAADARKKAYRESSSRHNWSLESAHSSGGQSISDNSTGAQTSISPEERSGSSNRITMTKLFKSKVSSLDNPAGKKRSSKAKISFGKLHSSSTVSSNNTDSEESIGEDNVYAVLLSLKNMSQEPGAVVASTQSRTLSERSNVYSNSISTVSSASMSSIGFASAEMTAGIRPRSTSVQELHKGEKGTLDNNANLKVKYQHREKRLTKHRSKKTKQSTDSSQKQRSHSFAISPNITVDSPSDCTSPENSEEIEMIFFSPKSEKRSVQAVNGKLSSISASPDTSLLYVKKIRSNSIKSESDDEYHTCNSERQSLTDLTTLS